MVIDKLVPVTRIHLALGNGETDRVRDPLTERACCCLNARHMAIFRMPRCDSGSS